MCGRLDSGLNACSCSREDHPVHSLPPARRRRWQLPVFRPSLPCTGSSYTPGPPDTRGCRARTAPPPLSVCCRRRRVELSRGSSASRRRRGRVPSRFRCSPGIGCGGCTAARRARRRRGWRGQFSGSSGGGLWPWGVGRRRRGKILVYPRSHHAVHPSPLRVLPSSHCSYGGWTTPSPQNSYRQVGPQPSTAVAFRASHCSPVLASTVPFPQTAGGGTLLRTLLTLLTRLALLLTGGGALDAALTQPLQVALHRNPLGTVPSVPSHDSPISRRPFPQTRGLNWHRHCAVHSVG